MPSAKRQCSPAITFASGKVRSLKANVLAGYVDYPGCRTQTLSECSAALRTEAKRIDFEQGLAQCLVEDASLPMAKLRSSQAEILVFWALSATERLAIL